MKTKTAKKTVERVSPPEEIEQPSPAEIVQQLQTQAVENLRRVRDVIKTSFGDCFGPDSLLALSLSLYPAAARNQHGDVDVEVTVAEMEVVAEEIKKEFGDTAATSEKMIEVYTIIFAAPRVAVESVMSEENKDD